jgi:eukaryotic-like serine/threonine-protein kinase
MHITPERWQQIEKLFHAALELKPPERAVFLEEACGNDESLRREVESLLGQKEKPEGFMTIPVVDQAIRLLADNQDATGAEVEIDQPKTPLQETGTLQLAQGHRPGEFGHYRIVRLLGKGGMGEVYEAEDQESGRRVALKILNQHLDSATDKQRFLREGRLAAQVSHSNCVYVYGSEEIDGTPVISMEFAPGGTLKDHLKREGPMSAARAVDAILAVIEGLQAAAAKGLLHRDIKPANCFVDSDGTVKIGDFGLSISTLSREETQLTAAGSFLGTPSFASPEQLEGKKLDVRSDIYAVGATLYYLLTGKPPFEAEGTVQLIARILKENPKSPGNLRPEIPKGLSQAILRCLEKDSEKRFFNYAELKERLRPFSSSSPIPADLKIRFVAGSFDFLSILTAVFVLVKLPLFAFGLSLTKPWEDTVRIGWLIAYFGLLEGLWDRSAGKALCGLKVVGPAGQRPGPLRAFLRAFVFALFFQVPSAALGAWAGLGTSMWLWSGSAANGKGWAFFTTYQPSPYDCISLLCFLVLFATMRRENGLGGIHELLSGTRVVRHLNLPVRPAIEPSSYLEIATTDPNRIGPYLVISSLRRVPSEELFLGYDPKLQRKTWIQVPSTTTPPVSDSRRDLNRQGRLRWLNGRRSAEECWDAYEAPEGRPFSALLGEQQPWSSVRYWLLDLITEFNASSENQSIPVTVALDRLWITSDGRLKLLDFAAPPLDENTNALQIVPMTVTDFPSLQLFLYLSSTWALTGGTSSSEPVHRPLPVHASSFLKELRQQGFRTSRELLQRVQSILDERASLSRRLRLGHLACSSFLPLITTLFVLASGLVSGFFMEYGAGGLALLLLLAFSISTAAEGLFGLLSGVLFRGGLLLKGLGMAVVCKDGSPASRLRGSFRTLIAWLPVLLNSIVLYFWTCRQPSHAVGSGVVGGVVVRGIGVGLSEGVSETELLWISSALVALFICAALRSAITPERGPQDRIAGTYLVPR